LARIGSLTLALLADGRALAELPTTLKAGLVLRRTFELLLDAELRLLQRTGGSLELVAIEVDDPQRVTEALRTAEHQTRLVAGFLDRRRVAIFARDTGDGAEGTIAAVVRTLGAGRPLRAAGATAVSGKGLPPLAGFDLLRLAEIALDQAELTGGRQRLSLHHEISQSVYPS